MTPLTASIVLSLVIASTGWACFWFGVWYGRGNL